MDEEELARQAVARIRDWMEKEPRSGKPTPRLAMKFCGGCNPVMDRSLLARSVRETLAGMVCWVPLEEKPDLAVVINGCPTACVDRAEIQENAPASLTVQGDGVSAIERHPFP